MKIVQKWGFGMAPPKPSTETARQEAARGVMALLKCAPAENLEVTLAQLSVVKGLFNRVAKEDQWDWFYVKGQLGYPSASIAKQVGFALANLRASLMKNDETALIDIRAGDKTSPYNEMPVYFRRRVDCCRRT
jgi:hypothetical protein